MSLPYRPKTQDTADYRSAIRQIIQWINSAEPTMAAMDAILDEVVLEMANVTHTHPISQIVALQATLDAFQTSLNGKAASSHAHAIADSTGLQAALDGKSPTVHAHAIADTTGLQAAIDGKAATSHTHTIANVTNLQTTLDGKAAVSHAHAIADTTGLQAALDAKAAIVAPGSAIANVATDLNEGLGALTILTTLISAVNTTNQRVNLIANRINSILAVMRTRSEINT